MMMCRVREIGCRTLMFYDLMTAAIKH